MDEVEILAPFLSTRRRARIEEVLAHRTRSLTAVFEAVHDPHNVAAVLRSAESCGLQEVHAVRHPEAPTSWSRRVTKHADKWLDVRHHPTIEACLESLRAAGYAILVSAVHGAAATPLASLDFSGRVAVVFGNEKDGASAAARDRADQLFHIPMRGFTESFNVSVAAALTLHHAVRDREQRLGRSGDLDAEEQQELRRRWFRQSVRAAEAILARARREGEA